MSQYEKVNFTLNGRPVEKMVDVRLSLADMLRDECGMTSVKQGCKVGECGACTVLIDGQTLNSCIYLAVWADGKDIVTVEGLQGEDGSLSPVQQAFVDEGAIQCGFCTPGFVLTAAEIERERREAGRPFTEEEIRRKLSGHLCRCTGY
jgi:carbon-monoxide dehydrogenase small subunit